jgi:uncharacterized protein YwgA
MADKEATLLLKVKETGSEAIGGVTKFLLSLSSAINIGKAAWEAIKKVTDVVMGAWGEQESAINSLNQSLIQQGIYTKELSQQYLDMATALSRASTYGDEQIVQAQSLMQSYVGQIPITKELIQATLDFASAKKMDLVSATDLVGKSIGSETNALSRNGIELDAGATKTEKLSKVVEQLNSKFGGQAAAAAKGEGTFKQMNNAIGELFEILGGKLAPIIIPITQSITKMAYAIADSSNTATTLGKTIAFLSDAFTITKGVLETFFNVVKFGFQELYSVVEEPLKKVGEGVKVLADGIGSAMKTAFKYWSSDAQAATNDVSKILNEGVAKTNAELAAKDQERLKQIEAAHLEEEEKNRTTNARKQEIEAANNQIKLESFTAAKQTELENELALEQMRNDATTGQRQTFTQAEIDAAKTKEERLRMMQTNQTAFEQSQSNVRFQAAVREGNLKKILATEQVQTLQSTLSTIATMQDSHNKTAATVAKAAAIANIIISTAQGAAAAMSLGPILGPILMPIVVAAGAMQIAKVSGVALAEGGIVKAREGGIQATIGEGGRDEAVIPLDKAGNMGGNTINIINYGGLLGSPSEAHEFAVAVDRELLKLRQGNESQAFDSSLV